MKKLSVLAIMLCVLFAFSSCENLTQKLYSGEVVDKLRVPDKSGSVKFHTFFKDSKSGRVLKVRTTPNVYYTYKVGDTVSFNLSENELKLYGN
jgi:hypothetical protein